MKIGAQLFSVRDYAKTLEDFEETLKKVADIGYTTVQVSGTCDYEAEWLDEKLKENGLTCNLTHYKFEKMMADPEGTADFHKKFGCKYIGVGMMPHLWEKDRDVVELCHDFVRDARDVAKTFKEKGALLMYHNHQREYFYEINGMNLMDYLASEFAPDELGFTLDMHWVMSGNHDPLDEVKHFAGRLPCVHFKDLVFTIEGEKRFAPIGEGVIKFEPLVGALEDAGTEFIYVEQDKCYDDDPFACLKRSYDYLRSIGLD